MHEDPGHLSWDDIEYDLEGTQKAQERITEFFANDADALRNWTRSQVTRVRTRGGGEADPGSRLMGRCPKPVQLRYATLLSQEKNFQAQLDHGFLIGPACQILESELDRLLASPARGIVGSLIAALSRRNERGPALVLEKWADHRSWTTMGVESVLLLALRRGCEQGVPDILGFLDSHFSGPYRSMLMTQKLGQCLEVIRVDFRNPWSHGIASPFDAEAYMGFTQLIVAHERFGLWDTQGPVTKPPDAGRGILHHHLQHARPPGPRKRG